jgi:hypothetical protein
MVRMIVSTTSGGTILRAATIATPRTLIRGAGCLARRTTFAAFGAVFAGMGSFFARADMRRSSS